VVTTGEPQRPSSCLCALEAACALGRADGLLAVEVDPIDEPFAASPFCHGLDPEDLARHVWGAAAGDPPAAVRLNAPAWYAHGFRDALASARAERSSRTS
jgi:hypothetical protein